MKHGSHARKNGIDAEAPEWFRRFFERYEADREADLEWRKIIEGAQRTLGKKQVEQAAEIVALKSGVKQIPCGRCACCLATGAGQLAKGGT